MTDFIFGKDNEYKSSARAMDSYAVVNGKFVCFEEIFKERGKK